MGCGRERNFTLKKKLGDSVSMLMNLSETGNKTTHNIPKVQDYHICFQLNRSELLKYWLVKNWEHSVGL